MENNKKQQTKINQKKKKNNYKVVGLDIDKAEYQEIVLSNSNFPDKDLYK